jgi:hypothetical protein
VPVAPARTALARWGWLLPFALCLVLGHLLAWDRGLYKVDYLEASQAVDPVSGAWRALSAEDRIPFIPVRSLKFLFTGILQGLLPDYTFAVRALVMLASGANALLLGWLAARILDSRLAGVVTAWLFIVPVPAFEAVFFLAAFGYLAGTALILLFLHACWSALEQPRRAPRWMALGTLALVAAHLFYEVFAAAALFPALLAVVHAARRPPIEIRAVVRRALPLTLWPVVALLLLFGVVFRSSAYLARRGTDLDELASSPVTDLAGRFVEVVGQFGWWTVSPSGGLDFAAEALQIGAAALSGSWLGAVLAVAAAAVVLVAVLTWPRQAPPQQPVPASAALLGAGFGAAWMIGAVLVPFVPIGFALPGARMVYFPLAGFALALGALAAYAAARLGARDAQRILLGGTGALLLVGTLCLVGYAEVYAARSRLDRQQIAAFVRAVPPDALPPNVYLVSLDVDETILPAQYDIAERMTGVFERQAMDAVLQAVYGRADMVASPGMGAARRRFDLRAELGADAPDIWIDDEQVPLERVLAFTYRDGAVTLVEHVTVTERRKPDLEVTFPLVQRLRAAGLPTTPRLMLRNKVST